MAEFLVVNGPSIKMLETVSDDSWDASQLYRSEDQYGRYSWDWIGIFIYS